MAWETVIGLEIHAQLATESKIFSTAATAYGAEPNTQAAAIDLGLPGVLPVINEKAVEMAAMFGLAIDAQIAEHSVFARKNYFYPDLPKGYQISQFELPIVAGGQIEIRLRDGSTKPIDITRAHLEEDAGKSVHDAFDDCTGIDLNRAGTPLLEIVSEPQLGSAGEAVAYMRTIHTLVRYLGICDGNMQEGSFRCDANVSVRRTGETTFGTRTETKNLNSFRFVESAIEFEVARQIEILEGGGTIVQETRLFDPNSGETRTMRGKEDAHDYRYFPDPDLLPVKISAAYLKMLRERLPELPAQKRARLIREFALDPGDAELLLEDRSVADYFETVAKIGGDPRLAANWVSRDVFAGLNRDGIAIDACPISAERLGGLLTRIADSTISGKIAQQVFDSMWSGGESADEIIDKQGLRQVSDNSVIEALVDQVINDNPEQLRQYRAGKTKVFGFFVGQVMKLSQGKADPKVANELLKRRLDE